MRRYLVTCRYPAVSRTAPETFLCEADDPTHAAEQAQDLHPNTTRHDVFELVPTFLWDSDGFTDAKQRFLCAWLNLTSAEWDSTPTSVLAKLWDAYNSIANPDQRRSP